MSLLGKLRFSRTPKAPKDPEGRMTLFEHLAELRGRLFKAVLAIFLGAIVGWIFYEPLFKFVSTPLKTAIDAVREQRPELEIKLNWSDIAGPLMMQLTISLVAGLVLTSPIWLYQLWAFILPGLHRNERKWTMVFVATAAPLFVAGVGVGYMAMPKGLSVLFEFTPPVEFSANLVDAGYYMSFIIRLLLVFGLAFEIPIFVILLNLVGVLSVRRMAKWRAGIVFVIFVFAAVATPSVDPITMLILALPMCVLFLGSEVVARIIQRMRRRRMDEEDPDLVVRGDDD